MPLEKYGKIIRLSKSNLSKLEKSAVMNVLDKEYLGMGEEVKQFEHDLTKYFGRPTVCVVNGTAALHLSLQAIDIGPGDEVLTPSITYASGFQSISATGAKPIACEVLDETITIDLQDARKRLTECTKAIMPMHYAGGVGKLDEIYKFANDNSIRVVEDAAHALGTFYKDKLIGSQGDIVCFSFDGIKNITSGEGGCIVSEDIEVIRRVKNARLLGVENNKIKNNDGKLRSEFDIFHQGWRYHMSNIMAAIGIVQLKRLPEFSKKRQLLAKRYDEKLKGYEGIFYLNQNYDLVVPHIYPIRISNLKDRLGLRICLEERGIQTGFHYHPNHLLSFYRIKDNCLFPNTDKIFPELLTLPLHPDMSEEEVDYIVRTLLKEFKYFIK